MKYLLALLLIVTLLSSCKTNVDDYAFYMPAEFESQKAVYVGWFNNPKKDSVAAQIVSALYNSVQVKIFYSKESMKHNANLLLSGYGVDSNKISWIKDSLRYDFPRDPGPVFLVNKKGEMKIADFNWNLYGYPYVYKGFQLEKFDTLYGEIEKREAARLGLETISSNIVNEGGAFEVNGNGVMMAIEETALQRNPGKSLNEIRHRKRDRPPDAQVEKGEGIAGVIGSRILLSCVMNGWAQCPPRISQESYIAIT